LELKFFRNVNERTQNEVDWAANQRISLVHSQPDRSMQKGHIEKFQGQMRDEFLNATCFRTFDQIRSTVESWRIEDN
jgi:hypothetical protein